MREIKFRAWDAKRKKMIDSDLLYNLDCSNELPFLALIKQFYGKYEIIQYTGLKDVNGKEIFEDDIIQYAVNFMETIGVVKWGNKRGGFVVKYQFIEYPTKSLKTKFYSIPSNCKVIGNIYDNPELLKG